MSSLEPNMWVSFMQYATARPIALPNRKASAGYYAANMQYLDVQYNSVNRKCGLYIEVV